MPDGQAGDARRQAGHTGDRATHDGAQVLRQQRAEDRDQERDAGSAQDLDRCRGSEAVPDRSDQGAADGGRQGPTPAEVGVEDHDPGRDDHDRLGKAEERTKDPVRIPRQPTDLHPSEQWMGHDVHDGDDHREDDDVRHELAVRLRDIPD